jgi:hypothetical protein
MFRKIELGGSFPRSAIIASSLGILILFAASLVFSHGGKEHATSEFTAFQALQKATKLYDRLVDSGKLEESWETDLIKVEISSRSREDRKELVVSFHRAKGEPNTVYIFFSDDGEYAGSNFTGK